MLEKTATKESAARFSQTFACVVQQPGSPNPALAEAGDVAALTGALQTSGSRRSLTLGRLSFAIVVFLPTYWTGFDSLVVASNRYVSEFRVAVRSIERQKLGGLGDLLGFGGVSPAGNDSYAVVQYLQSRQAVADLGGAKAVGKLFNGESIDWFSRLDANATIEQVTRYWDRMVEATYENSTGTIIVRVATFDAEDSKSLARLC